MQLYLSLFFEGSPWELANLIISFFKMQGIKYRDAWLEKTRYTSGEVLETVNAWSEWFIAWIDVVVDSDEFREYLREECKLAVNRDIDFQMYPGCDEEMFSRLIAYLLEKLDGDFYLRSEWDDIILQRKDRQLQIEKESWKEFPALTHR